MRIMVVIRIWVGDVRWIWLLPLGWGEEVGARASDT